MNRRFKEQHLFETDFCNNVKVSTDTSDQKTNKHFFKKNRTLNSSVIYLCTRSEQDREKNDKYVAISLREQRVFGAITEISSLKLNWKKEFLCYFNFA